MDALTERLLAFYSYMHKNTLKITEVLLWKRVGVENQKEIREIRNNFIKTHERVAKKLERTDIPIYADNDRDLDLGVFAYEVRDYSNRSGMKIEKKRYIIPAKKERRLVKMIVTSKFILRDMCDKIGMSEVQAKIFLHSHGIDHMDKKIFPQSLWKQIIVFVIGILVVFVVCCPFLVLCFALESISIIGLAVSGLLFGAASIVVENYVKYFMIFGYNPPRKYIGNNIHLDMPM